MQRRHLRRPKALVAPATALNARPANTPSKTKLNKLVDAAIAGRGASKVSKRSAAVRHHSRALEVQRLAANGTALERTVVVDVTGLCVHLQAPEQHVLFDRVVPALDTAARLARRRLIWVVSRLPAGALINSSDLKDAAACILACAPGANIVTADCSLGWVLEAAQARSGMALSVVTAAMPPSKMWWLNNGARSVLTVADGKLWTAERCTETLRVHPSAAPRVLALRSQVLRSASSFDRHVPEIEQAIGTGGIEHMPRWLRHTWRTKQRHIDAAEMEILGGFDIDENAGAEIASLALEGTARERDTLYIAANVYSDSFGCQFRSLAVLHRGKDQVFNDEQSALTFFRDLGSETARWFAPGAISFAAWLISNGIAISSTIIDSAWLHVALYSDAVWDFTQWAVCTAGLTPEIRKWLAEPGYQLAVDARVDDVPRLLAALDDAVRPDLEGLALTEVVERDLASTLPVVAEIYAIGSPLVLPHDAINYDAVNAKLDALQLHASETGNGDELATILGSRRTVDALIDIGRRGGSVARGMPTLQFAGRIGMRGVPLHSLIKSGALGKLAGSMLGAKPGEELRRFDFNAYEPRVEAAMFCDLRVLALCGRDDLHRAIAEHVYGRAVSDEERGLVKACTLSVFNRGTQAIFALEHALSKADAAFIFKGVKGIYSHTLDRLAKVLTTNGGIRTLGWHRFPRDPRASVLRSTLVQGGAATVFRAFLRALHEALRPLNARIVHHEHDAVIVCCKHGAGSAVQNAILAAIDQLADLLPELAGRLILRGAFKEGATWADVH